MKEKMNSNNNEDDDERPAREGKAFSGSQHTMIAKAAAAAKKLL